MVRPIRRLPLAIAVALAGCTSPPAPVPSAVMPEAPLDGGAWPYWPVSCRIHPLTRIAVDADRGGLLVETRVEFTDRDGVTGRACGVIEVALHDGVDEPAQKWVVDLRPLDANATYFDPVTRTYLMRLQLDHEDPPDGDLLTVLFRGVDGAELEAQRALPERR